MAGLRHYTVLVRCGLWATDDEAAVVAIQHGLETLVKAELITGYDPPIIVQSAMSSAAAILEDMVMRRECECGGDADAFLHEESLTHMAWKHRA